MTAPAKKTESFSVNKNIKLLEHSVDTKKLFIHLLTVKSKSGLMQGLHSYEVSTAV